MEWEGRLLKEKKRWIALLILPVVLWIAGMGQNRGDDAGQGMTLSDRMRRELARVVSEKISDCYMPAVSFAAWQERESIWILQEQMSSLLPFYGYFEKELRGENGEMEAPVEESGRESGEEILLLQEVYGQETYDARREETAAPAYDRTLEELLRAENEALMEMEEDGGAVFTPHVQQQQIALEELQDYESLVQDFYTIDSNTMAGSDQLDVAKLSGMDMTLPKDSQGPQILIYHTHSQEAFADSVPGDASTSIVGVGDHLAQLLTDTYGYNVLHHTAEYDADSRDDAYSKALPGIEQVLKDNPSIKVVIDLHRDQMPEGTRLVTELDGRPTARFMFFNGLSRTKKTGNIDYLYNENQAGNLAFSFQMQKKAYEYYPGLTRKIYLKGYRYNMHLVPRSLLIELGAQNNTVEEAMNACYPLAHILDMVLSGQ